MRSKEIVEKEKAKSRSAKSKEHASAPKPKRSSRLGVYIFSSVVFERRIRSCV